MSWRLRDRRRRVKNPRVGEHSVTHGFPRLQHADFGGGSRIRVLAGFQRCDLQGLHAGGGTRTPDTRIMMTARRGHLRPGRRSSGVLRCSQFGAKSGVGRAVGRTVSIRPRGVPRSRMPFGTRWKGVWDQFSFRADRLSAASDQPGRAAFHASDPGPVSGVARSAGAAAGLRRAPDGTGLFLLPMKLRWGGFGSLWVTLSGLRGDAKGTGSCTQTPGKDRDSSDRIFRKPFSGLSGTTEIRPRIPGTGGIGWTKQNTTTAIITSSPRCESKRGAHGGDPGPGA